MGGATVEFAGERADTAPLTWGQRAIWNAIGRTAPGDHYFNFGRILSVPVRARVGTLAAVAAAVARLISRHESLRTRIRITGGEPEQVVAKAGSIDVTVEQDGDGVAERLLERLVADRFDYGEEWPLRVGFAVDGARVRQVVLAFCHLAADGHGADVAVRDLRLLLVRGEPPTTPAPRPVDLARRQRSVSGQWLGRAALDYWTTEYRRIPATMFATAVGPALRPPYRVARLTSPAADAAARLIADRHRVSTGTVLLAACMALVGAATGHTTCAMMPIVNNRFQIGYRDLVGTLAQDGLCVLDLADCPTFDALVPRAWRAALRGYRHAHYDQVALDEALLAVGRERGEDVHPYCCLNDQRPFDQPTFAGPPPDVTALRELRGDTTLAWPIPPDRVSCRFCLHLSGGYGRLEVALTADTAYLPRDAIGRYLRALEELLVRSAFGEVRLDELPRLLEGD